MSCWKTPCIRTWALIIAMWMIVNPESIPIAIYLRRNLGPKFAVTGWAHSSLTAPSSGESGFLKCYADPASSCFSQIQVVLHILRIQVVHFVLHTVSEGIQGPIKEILAKQEAIYFTFSTWQLPQAHWSHLRAQVSHPATTDFPVIANTLEWNASGYFRAVPSSVLHGFKV